MKTKKANYKIGDTVVLTLQATAIIVVPCEFGNATVKISGIEQDPHFGPCYIFEGIEGSWPESSIAYKKG